LVQGTLLLPCTHTATAAPKRQTSGGVTLDCEAALAALDINAVAPRRCSPKMPRLLCVALVAATASAFDVSWIPADPDGPLPLSKAYRENLKRLCDVVRTVKPLPPSIVAKLPVIEKLCAKLEASSGSGSALVNRLRFVGVVAAGAWAWHSYQSKGLLYDATRAARSRSSLSPRPLSPRPPAPSKSSLFDPGAL
jgi:hypothetical protein